jgi:hypothetical protein
MFLGLLAFLPKLAFLKGFQGDRFEPVNFDAFSSSFCCFFNSAVENEVHPIKELVGLQENADRHDSGEQRSTVAGDCCVDSRMSDDYATEKKQHEVRILSQFVGTSVAFTKVAQQYTTVHRGVGHFCDEETQDDPCRAVVVEQDLQNSQDAEQVVDKHVNLQKAKIRHAEEIIGEVTSRKYERQVRQLIRGVAALSWFGVNLVPA